MDAGIGVIAVVEHRQAADLHGLGPHGDAGEVVEGLGEGADRHAELVADGPGGQGVLDVARARAAAGGLCVPPTVNVLCRASQVMCSAR